MVILQCPFVGGFIHLSESNLSHLIDQPDFEQVYSSFSTVRFVIYPDSELKNGKLNFDLVQRCVRNLEDSGSVRKMLHLNFWD